MATTGSAELEVVFRRVQQLAEGGQPDVAIILLPALVLLLGSGGGADRVADRETGAAGDQTATDTIASASTATTDTAGDAGLQWGPAPPGLPTGARLAVVSGDPGKSGPFTIRVDMPPDYAIRPHRHPTSEELQLFEGTLHLGHGGKWEEKAMKAMAADQPVTLGPKEPHFLLQPPV